ncbi:hypothetical protein BH09ACT4_BH09ACT4_16710 [soil metagenome]
MSEARPGDRPDVDDELTELTEDYGSRDSSEAENTD